MLSYIKSLFKKKTDKTFTMSCVGDTLVTTTVFNNRVEVKKYELIHSVTEYKNT